MRIPFLDLRRQFEEVGDETQAAIRRVLDGGAYILGGETQAFEEEWARFCGANAAVGVNSGTDALALALNASGAVVPGRGDEVITTPLTAAYTALAIIQAGGVPVFADIDPRTYTLDPHEVERAVTPRTRAVVPVHLYGQLADMDAVLDVATRHGLYVLEDAAQAHGARAGHKRGRGHAAAFSFYPTKNLGAYGDAGAVTSDDLTFIERVKELRQGGHPASLRSEVAGRNSRLDEIQAATLRVKLKRLEGWNSLRRSVAEMYLTELSQCIGLTLPAAREPDSHVYHLFVVQHPERERLRDHLAARGVETMIHYPFLLHQQPLFRRDGQQALPVAEGVAGRILSLPLYPQIRADEIRAVISAVADFGARA